MQGAGNFKNNGLNTANDRDRFMDRSKDWMDKNNWNQQPPSKNSQP